MFKLSECDLMSCSYGPLCGEQNHRGILSGIPRALRVNSGFQVFCRDFIPWYNKDHHHLGIGLMTPESVHYGFAKQLYEHRKMVLRAAFDKNPNRFKGRIPQPPELPKAAWINPPSTASVGV